MSVFTVLGILGGLIAASLFLSVYLYRHDPEFGKIFAAVQTILSIGGLLVAAYWYFVERKGMPHANVQLTASAARMSKEGMFVMTRMDITNTGTGLLTIKDLDLRVMSVAMSEATEAEVEALAVDAFPAKMASGRALYDSGELSWRTLKQYKASREIQIEPGETDSVFLDFVLPCTDPLLKITGSIRKPGKEDLWYKDRKILNATPICQKALKNAQALIVNVGK